MIASAWCSPKNALRQYWWTALPIVMLVRLGHSENAASSILVTGCSTLPNDHRISGTGITDDVDRASNHMVGKQTQRIPQRSPQAFEGRAPAGSVPGR